MVVFSPQIKQAISSAVLCWLGTSDADGVPNVSPKELWTHHGDDHILIANIASPGSAKNIRTNKNVCVSFVDIFTQQGYQMKGSAEVVNAKACEFSDLSKSLLKMAGPRFPFTELFDVEIHSIKPILAPSYLLYPEETDIDSQRESAYKTYGVRKS